MLALASLTESAAVTDSVSQIAGKFVYITESAAVTTALSAAGSTYGAAVTESQTIQASSSFGL